MKKVEVWEVDGQFYREEWSAVFAEIEAFGWFENPRRELQTREDITRLSQRLDEMKAHLKRLDELHDERERDLSQRLGRS